MPPAADANAMPRGLELHEAKAALRREALARRDALPVEDRSRAAHAIAARIAALPSFVGADTVLLTLAFRSEWDTMPLVRAALAAGKTVGVPRVDDARRTLELHAISDPLGDVVAGFRGIPEPRADAPALAARAVDWALVPGVAFDGHGRRLGYGGGYYDRLLPQLRNAAHRVAGAFDVQLVDRVPAAPHDALVDAIVTETRTIVIRER